MKGSFVRKAATGAAGLHGQTLLSSGLADWDKLLGGGLPLGTVCLLLEDCHSQQHLNFIRYFLAEAVMTNQQTAWLAPQQPHGGVAAFLPAWVNPESSSSAHSSSSAGAGADLEDEGLRIAWQYRKYIQAAQQQRQAEEQQQAGSKPAVPSSSSSGSNKAGGTPISSRTAAQKAVDAGVSRQWCHTYDLSQSMDAERVSKHGLVCQTLGTPTASMSHPASNPLSQVTEQAIQFIQRFTSSMPVSSSGHPVPVRGPQPVGRVVIQSVLSPAWAASLTSGSQAAGVGNNLEAVVTAGSESWQEGRAAARLLFALRQAVQDSRCAVLVTLQADMLKPAQLAQLQHMCHTVITLGSISDASDVYKLLPDPTSAAALLSIQRLPAVGMLAPRIIDSQLYVVRHKRKKLAITPVDVDPDAQTKQQEATAAAVAALSKLGVAAGGVAKAGGHAGRSKPTSTQAAKGLDF